MKSGTHNKMHLSTAWIVAAIFAAFLTMGMLSFVQSAHANPFYAGTTAQSAAATSTQLQLRAGFATSTVVYDSYEQYGTNQVNSGNVTFPNSVAIVVDGIASSTSSVINIACEYSENYNGTTQNGDWYNNELVTASTTNAGAQMIQVPNSFGFTFASSTVGGAGLSGTNTRFQKVVQCQVPTRFVRAVVTNSGQPATVWVQIIPLKQRNSGN